MARSPEEIERIVRRIIELASQRLAITAAYLFGSYCDGTATDGSDIDIALFSRGADELPLEDRISLLTDIRLAVDAEVELHLFDEKCLRQARPTNIYGHIVTTGHRLA